MEISSRLVPGLINRLSANNDFQDLYVLTADVVCFAESFSESHQQMQSATDNKEELKPLLEKYFKDKSQHELIQLLDANTAFSDLFVNTPVSQAFSETSLARLWNKDSLSEDDAAIVRSWGDLFFLNKFSNEALRQISANRDFDNVFTVSPAVIDFIQNASNVLRFRGLTEEETKIVYKRVSAFFRNRFIEHPKTQNIIECFFAASSVHPSPQQKENEANKFYEIVKWNLGLPENHEKRVVYANDSFWKDAKKLLKAYSRIWLTEKEGRQYIEEMLDTRKPLPEVVEDKIRSFCRARLSHLEIYSEDNLEDCMAITIAKLLENDRQPVRDLENPGSLWMFLRKTVNSLFKISWEFSFTEGIFKDNNKIFAHLTFYSSSYIKKELLDNTMYYYVIRPVFREQVTNFYHPEEEVYIKRDNAKYNEAIKTAIADICVSLSIPYYKIGLSVDQTFKSSVVIVPDYSADLKSIYPFQDRLVEEDCSMEEILQPLLQKGVQKLENEDAFTLRPDSYTDFEIKQLLDVIFEGEESLRKVFITYTTQTGNKVDGQDFLYEVAKKLFQTGLLTVDTEHPIDSPEWRKSLCNKLLKTSGRAQEVFQQKATIMKLSFQDCLDIIRYCEKKSLDDQF